MLLLAVLAIIVAIGSADDEIGNYFFFREKYIAEENRQAIGGKLILNAKEKEVNKCLMQYKDEEYNYAFDNPQYFNFSKHFFKYKDHIPKSKVYQIIKDMPKGAILHSHDLSIHGPDYLLNITYMENLYVCFDNKDLRLIFADKPPNSNCSGNWTLMKTARASSNNTKAFDENLKKHFSMVVDDPDVEYPTIKESWDAFSKYFDVVVPLITYMPVWEQFLYDAFKELRESNIMYVEFKSLLSDLYDSSGTKYGPLIAAQLYNSAINRMVKDYPDFFGAKVIYAPVRSATNAQVDEYIRTARSVKKEVPDIFAGFDLVGQEDPGRPLIDFAKQLLAARHDLNYFFHAGETNWFGTSTDYNLVDGILLGAKRLGHAYALAKHPLLMEMVREKKIGIEVNVISNAVLSLVRDVRNHPLNIFIAHNLPVVLSCDDPGAWGADVLSYDFYIAFVGVASKTHDLRLLKSLAINSLEYSALCWTDKLRAMEHFTVQWNNFINKFDCNKYK